VTFVSRVSWCGGTFDHDLSPWKSIGFQILLRIKYVPSLVKIHWRVLILECSQECYACNVFLAIHTLVYVISFVLCHHLYLDVCVCVHKYWIYQNCLYIIAYKFLTESYKLWSFYPVASKVAKGYSNATVLP
jgi:hypothetical protein